MSDRCVVEKSLYNSLLEAYFSEVLPNVTDYWMTLSEEHKTSMLKLNNLFVGYTSL